MEYGPDHAEFYDIVFRSRGKDFEGEATDLSRMVRSRFLDSMSLLDVACGTGAHLETFAKLFERVSGLEFSPGMLEFARNRLPEVPVHLGDMRDFDLDQTFDAVVCMGNAVGCLDTPAELTASVARMAAHLVPGGVLIVEPWFFPENFIDGHVGGHMINEDGRVISRITHAARVGKETRHEVRFTIADSSGIREFGEVLRVSLFERAEYLAAFEKAGCTTEFVPGFQLGDGRVNSPGLFIGVRK